MFEKRREGEAALYYLYMMADGEAAESEKRIFDAVCKKLEIDSDEKNEIIEKCKMLLADTSNVLSILTREKIDEQVGEEWWSSSGLRDASSLARIIWNLVDLGYADSFYSKEEKKIVNKLVEKWSVSPEVYQEFIDTADTMLALTKQKEWAVSTLPKQKGDKKEKEINTEISRLLNDVKLTIEELTM